MVLILWHVMVLFELVDVLANTSRFYAVGRFMVEMDEEARQRRSTLRAVLEEGDEEERQIPNVRYDPGGREALCQDYT